jgi:hypothetical protein
MNLRKQWMMESMERLEGMEAVEGMEVVQGVDGWKQWKKKTKDERRIQA